MPPSPLVLMCLVALELAACAGGGVPDVEVAPVAADAAPPVDADLADAGWPDAAAWIAREAAAGRPTVVNLFASWCAPCRAEAPVLRQAIEAHPEIAWLGVAHRDAREDAATFVAQERLPFATLLDLDGEVGAAVGSRGLPTTAFFDHTGRLAHVHYGVLTEPVLAQRVADLAGAAGAG